MSNNDLPERMQVILETGLAQADAAFRAGQYRASIDAVDRTLFDLRTLRRDIADRRRDVRSKARGRDSGPRDRRAR